ncbi:hypothetical protein HS088_TW15G00103 [Tripterygium wilfordii]|uniref:FAD-binding domain-containing protein n=1 Tax=Tripterygium wilfordii TaxID=458696 RepID=A0A7J7CKR2_TRIWF|nr:hypothetical protein HS088_TW15G00103 [Tripterygium wilfordii]
MIKNVTYPQFHSPTSYIVLHGGILLSSIRKGRTVTVAGDAMHVMGPFIGQGGSAAIEDAIVLARCLAGRSHSMQKVGEAMDEYVREENEIVEDVHTNLLSFWSIAGDIIKCL